VADKKNPQMNVPNGASPRVLGTLDGKIPAKPEKSYVVHHGSNAAAAKAKPRGR
jgi:hypothetical protein